MRKNIIKVGSSHGVILNPTLLDLLKIDINNPRDYSIDVCFENGVVILKDAKKNEENEPEK